MKENENIFIAQDKSLKRRQYITIKTLWFRHCIIQKQTMEQQKKLLKKTNLLCSTSVSFFLIVLSLSALEYQIVKWKSVDFFFALLQIFVIWCLSFYVNVYMCRENKLFLFSSINFVPQFTSTSSIDFSTSTTHYFSLVRLKNCH